MKVKCFNCGGSHHNFNCPLCMFCMKRDAVLHFGDMLSYTHGGGNNCCEICCTEKQLEHALDRQAKIPELTAKLAELKLKESKN